MTIKVISNENVETPESLTYEYYKKARVSRFYGLSICGLEKMNPKEVDQYYMAIEALEAKEELQAIRIRELSTWDSYEEKRKYVNKLRNKSSM